MRELNTGKLYIVATPIGNLDDMTFRAINILKTVNLIVAEDTRRTKELLNHFEIKNICTSYNEHTDRKKIDGFITKLKEGNDIAIVSDAGTPLISDPGNILVSLVIENDIEVISIPGACAAINALVQSGISCKTFSFVGFLSEDNKERKKQLDKLVDATATSIIYISSHNLMKDLKALIENVGEERYASLSREMTKKYEETVRGSLSYIYEYFDKKVIKGEFVLVLKGIDENVLKERDVNSWLQMTVEDHFKYYIGQGVSEKDAIKKVAKDRDQSKSDIYKLIKVK